MKRIITATAALVVVIPLSLAAPTTAQARNAYVEPEWAPSAAVHTPLPDVKTLDEHSSTIASALDTWVKTTGKGRFLLDTQPSYTNAIVTARNSDPAYDIKIFGDYGEDKVKESYLTGVHIPADAKASTGSDGQLSIYNADTHRYVDLTRAHFENGVWSAYSGGSIDDTRTSNTAFPHAHPEGAYASASGLALQPYTITPAELRAGEINHPIAMSIPSHFEDGDVSAPAVATDGYVANKPRTDKTLSLGQRMRLPLSLNIDAMQAPRATKTIARAMQKYGVILVDSTSTTGDPAAGDIKLALENPTDFDQDPYPALFDDPHYEKWQTAPYFLLTGAKGSYDPIPLDKLQVLPRSYIVPTGTQQQVTWANQAIDARSFMIEAKFAPAGSRLHVDFWRADGSHASTDQGSTSFYSGAQPGWTRAQAQLVDKSGKVVSTSELVNPYAAKPLTWSTSTDRTTFGFDAKNAPAGTHLRISWTRNGVAQSTTTGGTSWWSGDQSGWKQARAELVDAAGKVVATSPTLNPPA